MILFCKNIINHTINRCVHFQQTGDLTFLVHLKIHLIGIYSYILCIHIYIYIYIYIYQEVTKHSFILGFIQLLLARTENFSDLSFLE